MSNPLNEKQVSDTRGDLPAGRDLDALVAERVMGWTVNRTGDRHWHTVGETGRERSIQIGSDCCAGQYYDNRAFCPSTDIRAAWEVVEQIRTNPKPLSWAAPHYDVSFDVLATGNDGYCAEIREVESQEWRNAWAETAPHAICLAALKAVAP